MSFTIHKATRRGVTPLIGLYGESGTGKTFSALLLARGLVGPSGEVHMIDTESKRGSLYADVLPGGYSVLDLDAPFTPARYIEALQACYDAGAKVVVIDSMSHEWEGMGGVQDMAAANEERSGKAGLHNWKAPKFEHAKLVQFLLRAPVPIVCCIRAKYKTRQRYNEEKRKNDIIKDDYTSPIQAEDFIFEMTAHAEVLQNHSINLTKCSHPELRKCFPAPPEPIGSKHGKMIAEWCQAASGSPGAAATASAPKSQMSPALAELMESTKAIHNGDGPTLKAWLVKEGILGESAMLSRLPEKALKDLKTQAEILLGTPA